MLLPEPKVFQLPDWQKGAPKPMAVWYFNDYLNSVSPYLRDGVDRDGGNTGNTVTVEVPTGEAPGARSRRTTRFAPIPAAVFTDRCRVTH